MRKHRMNKNVIRIGLAAIAAFYVVVGGLWASDFFPLQKFYAQSDVKDALVEKHGFSAAYKSKEYEEASAYQQVYAMTHPGIFETEAQLAFYQSLLMWGTVALGVGGGVLFLTRGRGVPAIQKDAQ